MSRRKFLQNITATSILAPLSVDHLLNQAEDKETGPLKTGNGQQALENAARNLRAKLFNDPLRPTYHFVSPEGDAYPFDPNGAIFWKGKYHLGYIYQHNDANGKRIHWWGHVISHDLFHWSSLPPMLTVEEKDPETGIFSGGAFLSREGVPHIVYHGTEAGNCIAKAADDDLIRWEKFETNPVLPIKKGGSLTERKDDNSSNAWDPHIWLEGDTYYQISGGNPAALFKSQNLKDWQYTGTFMDETKRMRNDTEDWSCPDFFKLGKKYVAVAISHNLGTQYYIGDFVNERFVPEKHERMNWYGGTFFAPETLIDDKGRRILWGWVLERRDYKDVQGWSGTMSLPRVLTLSEQGNMVISPPDEVKLLRYNPKTADKITLAGNGKVVPVREFAGNTIELHGTFSSKGTGAFGFKVLCSPDGKEETIIKYDPVKKEIIIDYVNSASPGNVKFPSYCMMGYLDKSVPEYVSEQRAPLALKPGEDLKLEIFIDKSIIEVFANRRLCVTQRVYPTRSDSTGVSLYSEGSGVVKVSELRCWDMAKTNFV
ncbi:Sucrose-6-phosphate hydrolase [Dyadobacter sp. CECT 9275]|uniref:beta-fructofuranosidase n=1 Tax=Dyadobacter helix TaxID=2822344 RepID=A0A916N8U4_9BACT|nr:glycoside hydrolase family 32 protein [Dyadobacter sp. CECT 9275]CAG5018460.1 Sucrose-6-phosphate hydrolase [Dyadobacter sp. CECT 9275]